MFTGIISHVGVVARASDARLAVAADRDVMKRLKIGASISVQGVCLTVAARRGNVFEAAVMPETAARTNLPLLRPRALVNLELPATPETFLSGHIVQGHIDGEATLTRIERDGNARVLTFSVPSALSKYIVEKGSIALNGISLTVIDARAKTFTVGIVPHTWKTTMLHAMRVGDHANAEADVVAKYVGKFAKKRS
jgi:riboflavin synthase